MLCFEFDSWHLYFYFFKQFFTCITFRSNPSFLTSTNTLPCFRVTALRIAIGATDFLTVLSMKTLNTFYNVWLIDSLVFSVVSPVFQTIRFCNLLRTVADFGSAFFGFSSNMQDKFIKRNFLTYTKREMFYLIKRHLIHL